LLGFGQCASSASLLQKGRHVIKTKVLGSGNKGLQQNLAGKVASPCNSMFGLVLPTVARPPRV
jgi:hypothetical protein